MKDKKNSNAKSIILTARSQYHPNTWKCFRVPAKEGWYFRRCLNACDGRKDKSGVQVRCGCGFPVDRTKWNAPDGWIVTAEWRWPQMRKDRFDIVIYLIKKTNMDD